MKTSQLLLAGVVVVLMSSCSSSKKTTAANSGTANPVSSIAAGDIFSFRTVSTDDTYGYTQKNPVKVGGVNAGPSNERKYLDALAGPNGEELSYVRLGSCCPFESKNGFMGGGLLDKYEIKWRGQKKPVIIYINMYDYEPLKAPVGFTIK